MVPEVVLELFKAIEVEIFEDELALFLIKNYICIKINIRFMELIQGISFIIALVLMPILCRGHGLVIKLLYLVCMTLLTPIFGYPVYRYIMSH